MFSEMKNIFYILLLVSLPAYPAKAEKDSIVYHTVKPDETLLKIARKYHVPSYQIIQWNNMKKPYTKLTGLKLIVWKKNDPANGSLTGKTGAATKKTDHLQTDTVYTNALRLVLSQHLKYPVRKISLREKISGFLNSIPPLLYILIIMMFYFILSILVLLVIVIIRRFRLIRHEHKLKQLREKYAGILTAYIYSDFTIDLSVMLKYEMKNKQHREIFMEQMLDLHSNLSGETADSLVALYHKTDLKKYTIQKVLNKNWHIKATGIRELAQMKVVEMNDTLFTYINDKNVVLQIEAELALVKLHADYPLHFLKGMNRRFTDWGQMNVYDTLVFHNLEIPAFKEMLDHKNESVVVFCLRMIALYRQMDAATDLLKTLHHPGEAVREQAINTLKKMEIIEFDHFFKEIYQKETKNNKLLLLSALDQAYEHSNLEFLVNLILNDGDFAIRLEAAKSLFKAGSEGELLLDALEVKADAGLAAVIKHAKDKRINV